MLRKPTLQRMLEDPNAKKLHTHYLRLMQIRLDFWGLQVPGLKDLELWMPECHHVSHAYAKAFAVDVVDGEKVFLTNSRTWFFGRAITGRVARYAHSWNVFQLAEDKQLIFDIIPNETCSLTPVVVEYPHPAYTEPRDGVAKRCIGELITQPREQERIDLLAEEFKRIAG